VASDITHDFVSVVPDGTTPGLVKPQAHWNAKHKVTSIDPADVVQDATKRFVTDAEKSAWDGKQDALGFTPENVANRRSSFQVSPDDAHYTTEKLVKDSLDGKSDAGHNHSLNNLVEKSFNSLTEKPVGAASVMFTPANPTGTMSTSYLMMGLGATIKFTPAKYGIIRLSIDGIGKTTGGTGYAWLLKIAYGTGVAPFNGSAAAGTVVGAILNPSIAMTSLWAVPFSKTVIITGLSVGVAYWFDIQFAVVGGGVATLSGLTATVNELQY
jgi:hypothetical protein